MKYVIRDESIGRDTIRTAWAECKRLLREGFAARVTVQELKPTRTIDQNDMFHAICGDIAKQKQWAGQWIDGEGWKRLLVDAWARAEGKSQGRVVPSLDGQSIVNLGIQTRRMGVGEMADLITFAQAYAVENGVALNDRRCAA